MIYTVGLVGLAIFFFALLVVVGSLLYKRRIGIKYSMRNMFPFEYTYKSQMNENFYSYMFLALFVMASIGLFVTFDMHYKNGFHIFAMIGGTIAAIMLFALFIVPLTNLRLHIIFATIFFTLNFATNGSILISAWRMNQEYSTPLTITCIILGIIIAVAGFGSMLNPRLTLNFKAIPKTSENGEVVYERPKWVVFAFTEWYQIILFILMMINITILTFIE